MAIIGRQGVRGGAGRGNLRPGRFQGRQNASAATHGTGVVAAFDPQAVLQYYAILLLLRIGGGATGFSGMSGRQALALSLRIINIPLY